MKKLLVILLLAVAVMSAMSTNRESVKTEDITSFRASKRWYNYGAAQ